MAIDRYTIHQERLAKKYGKLEGLKAVYAGVGEEAASHRSVRKESQAADI